MVPTRSPCIPSNGGFGVTSLTRRRFPLRLYSKPTYDRPMAVLGGGARFVASETALYRGTSRIRNSPLSHDYHRALGIFPLQGPRGALFLMGKVPL